MRRGAPRAPRERPSEEGGLREAPPRQGSPGPRVASGRGAGPRGVGVPRCPHAPKGCFLGLVDRGGLAGFLACGLESLGSSPRLLLQRKLKIKSPGPYFYLHQSDIFCTNPSQPG